ncbi:hypothetical protein HU200_039688 [Digitaria exilis]|uniref:Uncharacterized protein n=1 Tax=Digitaria exilis TaxID=1010633 RepID=A0A835EH88_9POAL|nr:hypothetical protein HU200_039688 [Digitaria exilis]
MATMAGCSSNARGTYKGHQINVASSIGKGSTCRNLLA